MPKKLIFMIGAPGSGKSTYSDRINELHASDIESIHVGDILRDEIENDTTMGKIVEKYLEKGDLVPGDVVIYEVFGRIKNSPKDIVLMDGFPRGLNQMKILGDTLLHEEGIELVSVIELKVSKDVARERLLPDNPSEEEIALFENKVKNYEEIIEKIEKFYEKDGLLTVIDAEREREVVLQEIDQHLSKLVGLQ
jgi:adenylate kinase